MPATVQVNVVAARDLPIMDRSSELTDAFVELKLGQAFEKTEVCAKTLNPVWDSRWFVFKVEEEDLQEEPLQVKLMDHDTYSAHNAIGKVYIGLNSLTDGDNQSYGSLDGWFPIFDTLHGIRGEVHLRVKVEVLKDQHRFRQSSCEVAFYTCPETPSCYSTLAIHGFVEELVVNDDPEYQWIDRIRTPRASNEARQRLFSKITGELQRKIGLKTLEVGGNAVIGYQQYFDLEGDTGIVVRGIGTCVSLTPKSQSFCIPGPVQLPIFLQTGNHGKAKEDYLEKGGGGGILPPHPLVISKTPSSGSEEQACTPNKESGPTSSFFLPHLEALTPGSVHLNPPSFAVVTPSSDFPFYTLTSLPPGILQHIGGVVSSRAVKLLDKIKDPDEPETRDMWWQEVRNEVRSHARAMGCNAVAGYSESTSICDTLCIFSATGTAVCISTPHHGQRQSPKKQKSPGTSVDDTKDDDTSREFGVTPPFHLCGVCHIPYSPLRQSSDGRLALCSICNSSIVPSIIISTLEPPPSTAIRGRGTLIQVRVTLSKKRLKGDENATFVSKQLPFLEYKIYTRLLNKLKIKGMNAIFFLQTQYTVGDTIVIGMATGTSAFLEALPPPSKVIISERDSSANIRQFATLQDAITSAQEENMVLFDLTQPLDIPRGCVGDALVGDTESAIALEFHLSSARQEAFVFDVEDNVLKEEDIMELILDRPLPSGFYIANTNMVPGISPSMLSKESHIMTIVSKKSLDPAKERLEKQCAQAFDQLNQMVSFKVRKMAPVVLTKIHYDVDLPEDDVLQVAVTAMVTKIQPAGVTTIPKSQSDEMIFSMEDIPHHQDTSLLAGGNMGEERNAGAVRITPLPFLCGYQVECYLTIVNFFLIRESTSIRENGGLDSFMHLFVLEAQAIARAHVAAVGGNALLNYRLNDLVLIEHPHKNQAQCLLNVSGDAALISPTSTTMTAAHAAAASVVRSLSKELV